MDGCKVMIQKLTVLIDILTKYVLAKSTVRNLHLKNDNSNRHTFMFSKDNYTINKEILNDDNKSVDEYDLHIVFYYIN